LANHFYPSLKVVAALFRVWNYKMTSYTRRQNYS
jgi:hypothetical protein